MKPKVARQATLPDGRQFLRGSLEDFHTLHHRVSTRIVSIADNLRAKEVREGNLLLLGIRSYDGGRYQDALDYFNQLDIPTEVQQEIDPYLAISHRVTSVAMDYGDGVYEEQVYRWQQSWLRRFRKRPSAKLRCKHCGHYTDFIAPNDTWGWAGNKCRLCRREYPMPNFVWDSLDGQAYMYYRHSVAEEAFYEEFESLFDVEEPYDWQN